MKTNPTSYKNVTHNSESHCADAQLACFIVHLVCDYFIVSIIYIHSIASKIPMIKYGPRNGCIPITIYRCVCL